MLSGEAPIAESSTVDALLTRHGSQRRPVPTGILALLTVLFWAVWLYLVLPLVSLLLWAFGVRFFIEQFRQGGYEGLLGSLAAYSSVLLVIVGLLALWITWNVVRYGGSSDRRTVKRAEVPDWVVRGAFHLDDSLLSVLRAERLLRVDFEGEGVVVIADAQPRAVSPATLGMEAGPDAGSGPQRDRDRTRSGSRAASQGASASWTIAPTRSAPWLVKWKKS
jgi:poly-beta-1,6-N-acetyl-D-glucosamine biosynthesis protein PgaD